MNSLSVTLVAFFTSLATAAGTVYVLERWSPKEEPRKVPTLMGLAEADAKNNADANGLKLLVAGRQVSTDGPAGTVIRQSPPPGDMVNPNQPVEVTFAVEPPEVPDATGRSLAEARRMVEALGFVAKEGDGILSDQHEVGTIVRQNPEPGTSLLPKAVVTLHPSLGASSIEVPKFVGMNLNSAKAEAEKAKLKLAVQWVERPETVTYVVLSQSPAPGENVALDSEVKVVLNR